MEEVLHTQSSTENNSLINYSLWSALLRWATLHNQPKYNYPNHSPKHITHESLRWKTLIVFHTIENPSMEGEKRVVFHFIVCCIAADMSFIHKWFPPLTKGEGSSNSLRPCIIWYGHQTAFSIHWALKLSWRTAIGEPQWRYALVATWLALGKRSSNPAVAPILQALSKTTLNPNVTVVNLREWPRFLLSQLLPPW